MSVPITEPVVNETPTTDPKIDANRAIAKLFLKKLAINVAVVVTVSTVATYVVNKLNEKNETAEITE